MSDPEEDTILVDVENVLMSNQGPVVMLAPQDGDEDRVLPIFIDQGQALNIQLALEGQLSPRPMTHDLFSTVLNEMGAIVTEVVVEDLAQNTFYASLYIEVEGPDGRETKRFDARPSDCLALAVRVDADVEVRESVIEEAGIERSEMGPLPVDVDEDDDDIDLGVSR
jgi:bifunctional DNase/RNase